MIETGLMVCVIISIAELIKRLEVCPARFLPAVNLSVGIIFAVLFGAGNVRMEIFDGVVMGLTASGLYSGGKNVWQGGMDAWQSLKGGASK